MDGTEARTGTETGAGLPPFGTLVRQYRQAAALSQEALAERAGLSTDAISVIERGKRGPPRPDTVALLVQALGLTTEERACFVAAAHQREPPAAPGTPDGLPAPPSTVSEGAGAPPSLVAPPPPPRVAALPTGTLTFLLTDVEGSTGLWEEQPTTMRQALARHDALIEARVAQHGGVVVRPRGEGDSRFAVFALASSAVAAAAAIKHALQTEAWPALELRERLMGEEYARLMKAAWALRFSGQPEQQLQAIEALRENVSGAVPGGSTSVTAARARLQARAGRQA
jgi:transcriptional regulator with XRE-family HTH domain